MSASPTPETHALVATGFGDRDTGGGAFVLTSGKNVERVDWLASTGLAVDPDEKRVARLLRDGGEAASSAELLVSDAKGVEVYRRVDALSDAHDVVWHDDGLVVASAATNALLWLTPAGDVTRIWHAPGTGDAWHLNSLFVDAGRLLACAFGKFAEHRGWNKPGAAEGQGFVFDVESGETVLRGFTSPHHPLRIDGDWAVCDSRKQAFVILDETGDVERERISLGGWTRGVAVDRDHIYVWPQRAAPRGWRWDRGNRRPRSCDASRNGSNHFALPRGLRAPALMPYSLIDGLRRGFRTNALRTGDEDMRELFRAAGVEPERLWAVSDPLPPEACRVAMRAEAPSSAVAGEAFDVPWRVVNRGGAVLHSADPYPVHIASRWFSVDGTTLVAEGERGRVQSGVATWTGGVGHIARGRARWRWRARPANLCRPRARALVRRAGLGKRGRLPRSRQARPVGARVNEPLPAARRGRARARRPAAPTRPASRARWQDGAPGPREPGTAPRRP